MNFYGNELELIPEPPLEDWEVLALLPEEDHGTIYARVVAAIGVFPGAEPGSVLYSVRT